MGDRLQAEVEMFFAHLTIISPASRCSIRTTSCPCCRCLGVFDVGRDADGSPLLPIARRPDAACEGQQRMSRLPWLAVTADDPASQAVLTA